MGLSFKESKEIFGEQKAIELFNQLGLNTKPGRQAKPKREQTEKEYIKMSEYDHAKIFTKYINDFYPNIKFTHVANESGQVFTKNIMIMMAKKKAIGVSPGFPDYIIQIPLINNNHNILYIELKKAKGPNGGWNGSSLSEEQADWLNKLQNSACSYCEIAHGSREAIEIFERYINELKEINGIESYNKWYEKKHTLFSPTK